MPKMPRKGPPPLNPAARHQVRPDQRGQAQFIMAPLVIVFRTEDGDFQTRIHRDPELDHRAFALIAADLVAHIANAFQIEKEEVWEVIDEERANPTANPFAVYRK